MQPLEVVSNRLVELEGVIDRGRRSFIEVGLALLEIRDGRLYKERGYRSFDDYVGDHLGFQRSYAGHLIRGAQAVTELGTTVPSLPTTERQARELARVPEGQRVEVMRQVAESGRRLTAETIREVVDGAVQIGPQREMSPELLKEFEAFEKPIRPQRQLPSPEETFRGMLNAAVSYGVVVAEFDPNTMRRMFEEAMRAALRDLNEMT